MARMGLALWSLGRHARRNILPAIGETCCWRYVGAYTRDEKVGADVRQAHGGRSYVRSDDMLRDPEVAAILIAGPNGVHREQALRCLDAGKGVLIEKSMCADLAGTSAVLVAARTAGLLAAECFMYKHHPQFGVLRGLVADSGRFGATKTVAARFGFPHLKSDDIRYSRALSGGALLDAGAYCLSSVAALDDDDSPTVLAARLTTAAGYEVDTEGTTMLSLANGATGLCDWGFGRAYRNEIEIWCERATIVARRAFSKPADLMTTIRVTDADNGVEDIDIPSANHFVAMLDAMGAAMCDPAARSAMADEAYRQAERLDAVRRQAGLRGD